MTDPLAEMSPAALAAAIEANQAALFANLARLWNAEVIAEADADWFISGMYFPLFNGVLRSAFAGAEADGRIAALMQRFHARGLPMSWHVGPSSRPPLLEERLQAYGLWRDVAEPGMAITLDRLPEPPLPAGLSIVRVQDGPTLTAWLDVVRGGFGLPPIAAEAIGGAVARDGIGRDATMRHYLGLLDGSPIASATLFPAAGVGGVYNVATLRHGRRRGIGASMTLAALREARQLGFRAGILQATQMGLGVYRRLGFRQYTVLTQYVWVPGVARG